MFSRQTDFPCVSLYLQSALLIYFSFYKAINCCTFSLEGRDITDLCCITGKSDTNHWYRWAKATAESWWSQHNLLKNITSLAGDNDIFCLNVYLHYLQSNLFAVYYYLSRIFREVMMLNVSCLPTVWNSAQKFPGYSSHSQYSSMRSRMCRGCRCHGHIQHLQRRTPLSGINRERRGFPRSWKWTGRDDPPGLFTSDTSDCSEKMHSSPSWKA